MPEGTATTSNAKAFTLADIYKAKALIDSLPVRKHWMLVSPEGKVWEGTPDEMMRVIAPNHSLLQLPSLNEILQQGAPE